VALVAYRGAGVATMMASPSLDTLQCVRAGARVVPVVKKPV